MSLCAGCGRRCAPSVGGDDGPAARAVCALLYRERCAAFCCRRVAVVVVLVIGVIVIVGAGDCGPFALPSPRPRERSRVAGGVRTAGVCAPRNLPPSLCRLSPPSPFLPPTSLCPAGTSVVRSRARSASVDKSLFDSSRFTVHNLSVAASRRERWRGERRDAPLARSSTRAFYERFSTRRRHREHW